MRDAEHGEKRAAAKRVAASFGEVVTLLMRSRAYRDHKIAHLEWLIAPAILNGQVAIAEAQSKETGRVTPGAAALWAFVSPELDKRLSNESEEILLRPEDWRSGDIPWVVMALGEPTMMMNLLRRLTETAFKDSSPKIRMRSADGTVVVRQLADVLSEYSRQINAVR